MCIRDSYNRAYACKAIEEALKESRAENKKFALLLLDVDYFKNANDQYGHQFGDRVLEEVAIKVRNSVRSNDICARIGGDEFLIFMEYKNNIELLVDRVYQAIGGRYENFVCLLYTSNPPESRTDNRYGNSCKGCCGGQL